MIKFLLLTGIAHIVGFGCAETVSSRLEYISGARSIPISRVERDDEYWSKPSLTWKAHSIAVVRGDDSLRTTIEDAGGNVDGVALSGKLQAHLSRVLSIPKEFIEYKFLDLIYRNSSDVNAGVTTQVHCDLDDIAARNTRRNGEFDLGEEAVLINAWIPLKDVTSFPLALLMPETVEDTDRIDFPYSSAHTGLKYNPKHDRGWLFFDSLQTGDVIFFSSQSVYHAAFSLSGSDGEISRISADLRLAVKPRTIPSGVDVNRFADANELFASLPKKPTLLYVKQYGRPSIKISDLKAKLGTKNMSGIVIQSASKYVRHTSSGKPLKNVRVYEALQKRRMSAIDLLDSLENFTLTSDQPLLYQYYSAPNESNVVQAIRELVPSVSSPLPLGLHPETHSSQNVFISGSGATAWNHYDASYNVFFQLYGTKKIILSPPSDAKHMVLHSFLVPHFRRTHLAPGKEGSIAVKLVAGDTLFIPPFWFHHVISESKVSISMNAWLGSTHLAAVQKAIRTNVTNVLGIAHLSRDTKASILERLIYRVVASARGKPVASSKDFVNAYVLPRWNQIHVTYPKTRKKFRVFCSLNSKPARIELAKIAWKPYMEKWSEDTGKLFSRLEDGGRDIELGNWVESVAYNILGSGYARYVGSYLAHCFA